MSEGVVRMLEFLDNYENKDESRYPYLHIDWLTNFEIQFIQNKFSNYSNSLLELSELNGSNEMNSLYENSSNVDSSNEDSLSEDLDGSAGAFDGFFSDDMNTVADMDTVTDMDLDSGFGDIFGDNSAEEEEISLDELLSISESDEHYAKKSSEEKSDIFDCKLPVFVGDEKITEAYLNADTLKCLNHFFKRNWVLRLSETENVVLNGDFIIKNILNL